MKKYIAVTIKGFYEVDTESKSYKDAYGDRDPIEVDLEALNEGHMDYDELVGMLDDLEADLKYFEP